MARYCSVIDADQLKQLDAQQLRDVVQSLMNEMAANEAAIARRDAEIAQLDAQIAQRDAEMDRRDRELAFKQAIIEKITHEIAVLKRLKFAAKSEHFNPEQKSLLDETIEADLAALQAELDKVKPRSPKSGEKNQPKRQELPANLPHRDVHHEPENTTCGCGCALKRIGCVFQRSWTPESV